MQNQSNYATLQSSFLFTEMNHQKTSDGTDFNLINKRR